jgi:hypothetical protein
MISKKMIISQSAVDKIGVLSFSFSIKYLKYSFKDSKDHCCRLICIYNFSEYNN